jgi:hypothetical protein
VAFLRLAFSDEEIHLSSSLDCDIIEAPLSHKDTNEYHNAHVVHQITFNVHFHSSFPHSTIFLHDSFAFFIASSFFDINTILI